MTTSAARRVPVREGIFTIPDAPDQLPQLRGTECPACGAKFSSKRAVCLACSHRGLRQCLLSPTGTIATFTIVRQTPPGSILQAPYAIAQVRLDDGPYAQTALVDVDLEHVRIGQPVEMTLFDVRRDDDGNQVVAYAFRPRKEA